ncbi:hypothetical protein TNCV_1179491 [Trichonephila clavipes]|nr:hypothetical protein TNCV_1179491 [Trichonephila clavipes]
MPKSNAQRRKEFREKKKKTRASPVKKVTKKQKNNANSSSATTKSRSEYISDRGLPCHEFEPSTTKVLACRAAMHVKSIES